MSAIITPRQTAPRLQLLVNGTVIPALSATVNSNNFYQADSYKASVLPSDPVVSRAGFGPAWWLANATGANGALVLITVQIDPGLTTSPNWTTLIVGEVDQMTYDPITGLIDIHGRDRTAELIETKIGKPYFHQTSSEVAQTIAAEHGLIPQITPTKGFIDRFYSGTFTKTGLNNFARVTTEWDMLSFLAQHEGFDVFVSGNTLYFQPTQESALPAFVLNLDARNAGYLVSNGIDIKFDRSLTLAKDVKVTVQSYSSANAKSISVTASASGVKAVSAGNAQGAAKSNTTQYTFTRPNLSVDQAEAYAKQKLKEISQHERKVTITMPGEVTLSPRQTIQVTGTGTDCDMIYFIHEITREISAEGFTQTVAAKNSPPKDEAIIFG